MIKVIILTFFVAFTVGSATSQYNSVETAVAAQE